MRYGHLPKVGLDLCNGIWYKILADEAEFVHARITLRTGPWIDQSFGPGYRNAFRGLPARLGTVLETSKAWGPYFKAGKADQLDWNAQMRQQHLRCFYIASSADAVDGHTRFHGGDSEKPVPYFLLLLDGVVA